MGFEFNIKIGRTEKDNHRSLSEEGDSPDKKSIEITDSRVAAQPVSVKNADQAMKISAALRCTDILSGTIASLPLQIRRRQPAGNYLVDEDNELHYLLTKKASRRLNSYDMICNAVIQIVNHGNAYILIKRAFGDVSELVLCSNDSVTYDKYRDLYVISDFINCVYGTYKPDDIIHLKNKSLDGGYTGVSNITYGSTILSVSASADNQSLRTFQNGTQIKGIVSGVKADSKGIGALADNQIEDVSERINKQLNNGKNIISVNGDMGFHQLSITPVDQQLMDQKEFGVFDVCRVYGVHPDKVFAGQSTNYKASEMSQVAFLTDTLDPILCKIEAEFNAKLIPRTVSMMYKIEFDRKSLYKTDIATQNSRMEKEIQYGVSTVNEWRVEQENKEPVPGGDTVFISCNVAPIDSQKIKGEKEALPNSEQKT